MEPVAGQQAASRDCGDCRARTLINGMMADEGWQAMTMLDWEEGRDYELAPGKRVHILPVDIPVAIEASLRADGPKRTEHNDLSRTDSTGFCSE
jgi:hypothetical protein